MVPRPRPPIAAFLTVAIGLPFGAFCATSVRGALDDRALVSVPAEVVALETDRNRRLVRSNSPNDPSHETTVRLTYRYTVGGTSHSSDRYAFDDPHQLVTDPVEVDRLETRNAPGAAIEVLVDPDDPTRSVRRRRELERPLIFGALAAGAVLWGMAIVGRWLVRRPAR